MAWLLSVLLQSDDAPSGAFTTDFSELDGGEIFLIAVGVVALFIVVSLVVNVAAFLRAKVRKQDRPWENRWGDRPDG